MKIRLLLPILIGIMTGMLPSKAADTLFVKETRIPILLERKDNVLFYMRINSPGGNERMEQVKLLFDEDTPLSQIKSVKLYYGGTEAMQDRPKRRFAPVDYVSAFTEGKTLEANPSYSVLLREGKPRQREVVLEGNQKLFPGYNFFWISLQMKPSADLLTKIKVKLASATVDGKSCILSMASQPDITHRMGIGVRHAGDDGISAFRIPGLVTTNKGTLLGVYDARHNSSVDLQEHIDIGLSRSTDGGKTWEKMRIPLSFGEDEGLPKAQNGVGDPSILVDTKTNTVWVVAAWTHGMGNQRAWWSSHQGMDKQNTAQLVLSKSTDDGKTWSAPINITAQVKKPEWFFLLQGPGRGITMQDGTLVFPIQYIGKDRIPNAGIMYSKDGGEHWTIHNPARTNTTEAQVAEVEPGVLMLNMRDNRGGSRAVAVTRDLGNTWTDHVSSRKALREPVCMASLISVPASENITGKDLLIFSNPDSEKYRRDMTIKVSTDGGVTWLPQHQLLLDEGDSWGYSCLTLVDKETVGILYESSVAHMTFQKVKLSELIR